MAKRKWKIVGLDKALEIICADERADVAAEIEQALRDFDPENEAVERVVRLEPGTRVCPGCCGALVELAILPSPDGQSERELIVEYAECDATFSEPLQQEPS